MVIEIGSPFKIESYRSKSFPRQELHATFAGNSRIATDIASNDNDITEIQARHRGRGGGKSAVLDILFHFETVIRRREPFPEGREGRRRVERSGGG